MECMECRVYVSRRVNGRGDRVLAGPQDQGV